MLSFADETAAALPAPFVLPPELRALFDWAEAQGGRVVPAHEDDGQPRALLLAPEGGPGTQAVFCVESLQDGEQWLGREGPGDGRLLPVARLGDDGSRAAYWLDDDGRQRIVVLGSGSGSLAACVLAETPLDLLRLLAVGYPEVCWPQEWDAPPEPGDAGSPGDPALRAWLTATFGVEVPRTAREVVPHPAVLGDEDSPDPFNRWLQDVQEDGA